MKARTRNAEVLRYALAADWPRSTEATRSCRRGLMPSLLNTLRRCHSTVRALMKSWAPISAFDRPSRARRAICASCAVRSSRVSAWSSHWASSTTQTRGCCSAASAKRLSVASPDQKTIGRGADAKSEHGREHLALWHRQPVEVIQQRSAELVEAAVRELHLRLHPDSCRNTPAGDTTTPDEPIPEDPTP
jgi:hypothetical protein